MDESGFSGGDAMSLKMAGSKLSIAGFPVQEGTQNELAQSLLSNLKAQEKVTLVYANSNFIVKCEHLLPLLHDERVIIANDGVGMDIVARLLYGRAFKANLNGTDFTPYLFRKSERPLKVFMYGGKPEVVRKAATHVGEQLGQTVVGYCDGYADIHPGDLVEAINRSGAEVLLVALGNPLQEEWILLNRDALDVPVVSGVGALFDFWAGDKPRAPLFIQKLRLEWCYRLCLEPKRLMRRYTIDFLVFLLTCIRQQKMHGTKQA
jgi:beta-1,4-glucosyltransferase